VQFGGAGSEYAAQPGLQQVSASAAFGAGYSGRNIRVGVVDSGIDGRHSEFSGRVHAGGDWQSASDGRIDLHGHGTHVAAILAGAKDGVGMHGVAPQIQLYAYRILNEYGNFGGRSGEDMIPGLVSEARRKNLHILNNSWGSRVEIDDMSRGEIETALPRELAAWQSAVNSGMVMVWAAGYLTYSLSAQALLAGLRMINVGEIFVPIDVLAQEDQITQTGRHWLTGRERDVLNGLLAGHSNKEIARAHGLSEVTIKHHLKSLRAKLGARNRTHAVCRAIELGIAEETLPAAS